MMKPFLVCVAIMASSLVPTSSSFGAEQVSRAMCDQLIKATPDANVAYQPGVDVSGHTVAPADLPGSQTIQMPKKLNIPLTLNLARTLDLRGYPLNQTGAGTEAEIGMLTVEGNTVSFNGQPLSDAQQDKLAVLCMHPNE